VQGDVRRFACTQCGKCCNRSPEVELSEAAGLSDVFVFRLLFRFYELPRTFADYRASGRTSATSGDHFHEKKRLLNSFAVHSRSTRKRQAGKALEFTRYLTISALTLDTRSGECSALDNARCSIHARRPLSCRSVPFHYSRAEGSAERDLAAFVATPGYRCATGPDAPIVLEAGRIVDAGYRRARADALALAARDRPWHQAILRRMKTGAMAPALPSLDEIQSSAAIAATTTSMSVGWQIAAEAGLIGADTYRSLVANQAAVIDRELASARCVAGERGTLAEMRAEYRRLLDGS
jgi:Fe-S-cluster containining protein